MKNYLFYILLGVLSMFFFSCEKDVELYADPTDRMEFVFEYARDSVFNYTFAYAASDVQEMVIEFKVTAMGFLSDKPRTVTVRQINSGANAAQAGKHYTMATEYTLPANETQVNIPVTLLRDATLKDGEYTLELALVANEDFQLGTPIYCRRKLVVADVLLKPREWGAAANHYLGQWGKEKHKVMIEAAAPYGVTIDDDWVGKTMPDYATSMIWRAVFMAKLVEINEALGERGPLKEDDDTIVVF